MKVTCPECLGNGEMYGVGCPGFVRVTLPCRLCGGTKEEKGEGQITHAAYGRYIGAQKLRERRVSRRVSLREMALLAGVTPSRISDIERGYVRSTVVEEAAYQYLEKAGVGRDAR